MEVESIERSEGCRVTSEGDTEISIWDKEEEGVREEGVDATDEHIYIYGNNNGERSSDGGNLRNNKETNSESDRVRGLHRDSYFLVSGSSPDYRSPEQTNREREGEGGGGVR